MNNRTKLILTVLISAAALVAAVGIGTVFIGPGEIGSILWHKIAGSALPENFDPIKVSILWDIRLPRVCLSFLVGAALAVSGTVMQSVLKNPLASSYTLGVSSGASLGAILVMVTGFTLPIIGMFTLPLMGFIFGLATVFAAIGFTRKLDRSMQNNTIILVGMVFSLFVNAILTLLSAAFREHLQQLILWQMGSFSGRDWSNVLVILPLVALGVLFLCRYSREMDIMTFGEDTAMTVGVDTRRVKLILIAAASLLTGAAVAFTGVIGFVDLIAPHVVRRFFGAAHRWVIPLSALFGGTFMAVADLAARTVLSPTELPVGAVTALIGAPFFVYVYFRKRRMA